MGWTYSHRPHGQTVVEWLREQFPETFARVEATRKVGRVVYAVLATDDTDSDYLKSIYDRCADGKYRQLLVILTASDKRDHYNTGCKDMTETMGPCEATCPNALLDMLSPLKADGGQGAEWARGFRDRCRAYNEAQRARARLLKPGTHIKLGKVPNWTDGHGGAIYEVVKIRGYRRARTYLKAAGTGALYRIPTNIARFEPEVIPAPKPPKTDAQMKLIIRFAEQQREAWAMLEERNTHADTMRALSPLERTWLEDYRAHFAY